jgi:hypothetical protein
MKKILLSGLLFISTIISLHAQLYTPSGTVLGTSTNNNVGIGNPNPAAKLTLQCSSGDSNGGIKLLGFTYPGDQNYWNDNQFAMMYNGVFKNLIASNGVSYFNGGNVGIGTANPTEKLEIYGKVKLTKGFSATNAALVYTGDTDYMFIGPQTGASANGAGITLSGSTNQQTAGGKGSLMLYSSGGSGLTIMGETANVGIGTTNPTEKLEISGKVKLTKGFSATNAALVYTGDTDYMFIGPQTGTSANGAGITLSGSTNQQTAGGKGSLMLYSSGGSGLTIIGETANVGIGTTNPDSKLTVKGKIHAEEVKVDLAVPADYVFEKYYLGESSLKPDYSLLTLSEVEKFTEANHHLPNVPSANEIKKNGLLLGEMSNVLLQKIEELTLYSIDQQKTINKQAAAIERLEKENESFKKLEERLSRLEKELETKK